MLQCEKGYVKVGDSVTYRTAFGGGTTVTATVTELTLTQRPGDKYGQPLESVPATFVDQNYVLFGLGDSWAYSHQIDSIN